MKIIRNQNTKNINGQAFVVAVDIGKSVHYGYFRTPMGGEVKPFPFCNTHQGFQEFWRKLSQVQSQQGLKECVIGFESTGLYAEPLFHYLRGQPVKLVQINPMHTKRLKELTGNSPNKTDRKDPRVIADVISLGHALTLVVPEGAAAHLRRLTHARERAIKRRIALFNQLHYLMAVVFPEFFRGHEKDFDQNGHLSDQTPSDPAADRGDGSGISEQGFEGDQSGTNHRATGPEAIWSRTRIDRYPGRPTEHAVRNPISRLRG